MSEYKRLKKADLIAALKDKDSVIKSLESSVKGFERDLIECVANRNRASELITRILENIERTR